MACVRKRRGKWVVDYRDTNGKRCWETVEGNREDAELRMCEIIGGGKKPVDRRATFKQWAENWLETEAKTRLKKLHLLRVQGSTGESLSSVLWFYAVF